MPFACPVPLGTQALRSGLNPEPPISGAGPYYLAEKIHRRLVVFLKNPNYHGPRAQPFDAIAIKMQTEPATAIDQVLSGELDAAILDGGDPIAGPGGPIAAQWGPGSDNAAAGDQRWFGAARLGVDYIALNPTRPAFSDPSVRKAVALALDRAAISGIWVTEPSADLLVPSVPGSSDAPVASPDLDAARALMGGRTFEVTMMGFPTAWGCGACRDFEVAVTGQLKAIGITVTVRHPEEDYPADAFEPGSDIDLLGLGSGTRRSGSLALLGGLHDIPWIGEANLRRARPPRRPERAGANRGRSRLCPHCSSTRRRWFCRPGTPSSSFFVSDRIGCGFVQPAIGAVDLLSLCVGDEAAAASPSP